MQKFKLITLFSMLILSIPALAEQDSIKNYSSSSIEIIEDKKNLINTVPGSVSLITSKELELRQAFTGNEVLRTIPGLQVVDEEGAGLRLNVGIRGMDPDRSRTLLMLEDGIPVALAPYGEPEMYYTPSVDRMREIEVLKGSGSIIYGPQTIGGVINYLTKDPPKDANSSISFSGGNMGLLKGKLNYGSSIGNAGFITELYHKRAERVGPTNYSLFDFSTKVKLNIDQKTFVTVKIGAYDEISNSTYVGLTQNMYENGDYYTIIAPNDELDISRYSGSVSYQRIINKDLMINTSVFGYNTKRLWLRQDFSRKSDASNLTGIVFGDQNLDGGAIFMRNSTGNRDREFNVAGLQTNLIYNADILGFENKLNFGARLMYEEAHEQMINGSKAVANSGNLISDETRVGNAFSAYFHDRISVGNSIVISPGIRYENFEYNRNIFRSNSNDTNITGGSSISTFIPGIGINYNLNEKFSDFAGMHRGFAPPRIKDAITNAGQSLEIDAELSWNYELGFRSKLFSFLQFESTIYYLDFENQIIPVSESSGGLGVGLVNGGETVHQGIEIGFGLDIANIINISEYLVLNGNVSYNNSYYSSDRFIDDGFQKINIRNNSLPYAPNLSYTLMLNYESQRGIGITFSGSYIGERYADELNTENPSNDGLNGIMESYLVADATISYRIDSINTKIFLAAKNLLDERYIASRRPRGIKVGLPRLITLGFDFSI